ncbi:hypothetical protein F4824DRAFT_379469 [Ustulina deusta]|nr:hypothetical protein F4824DRAFT_379469 [Ustulina deusta]
MYSVQYTNAQLGHGGLNSTTDLPISSTRPWIGFLGYYSADCPHRGPCPFVRKHSLPPMCFFFFFFFCQGICACAWCIICLPAVLRVSNVDYSIYHLSSCHFLTAEPILAVLFLSVCLVICYTK